MDGRVGVVAVGAAVADGIVAVVVEVGVAGLVEAVAVLVDAVAAGLGRAGVHRRVGVVAVGVGRVAVAVGVDGGGVAPGIGGLPAGVLLTGLPIPGVTTPRVREVASGVGVVCEAIAVVVDTVVAGLGRAGVDPGAGVVTVAGGGGVPVAVVVGAEVIRPVAVLVDAVATHLRGARVDGGVAVVAVALVLGEAVTVVVGCARGGATVVDPVAVVVEAVAEVGGAGVDRGVGVVAVAAAVHDGVVAVAVGVVAAFVHGAVAVVVEAVAGLGRVGVDGGVAVVAVAVVLGEAVAVVVDGVDPRLLRLGHEARAVDGERPPEVGGCQGDPSGVVQGFGRQKADLHHERISGGQGFLGLGADTPDRVVRGLNGHGRHLRPVVGDHRGLLRGGVHLHVPEGDRGRRGDAEEGFAALSEGDLHGDVPLLIGHLHRLGAGGEGEEAANDKKERRRLGHWSSDGGLVTAGRLATRALKTPAAVTGRPRGIYRDVAWGLSPTYPVVLATSLAQ